MADSIARCTVSDTEGEGEVENKNLKTAHIIVHYYSLSITLYLHGSDFITSLTCSFQ